MKISSLDKTCSVTLEYTGDARGYSGYQIEADVDIRHGRFYAKNIDVQFLNWDEFVSEYNRFILDRSLTPRLVGTYDSYIAFTGNGTAVYLQFCLGDAFCGRKTVGFRQSGEFEVEQQTLLQYLAGFRALMEARCATSADTESRCD
jgi:hypothetical protein